MNKGGMVWGTLLIFLGIFLLANNFGEWHILRMDKLWPLFILIPGLAFEFGYFLNRRNPGLLVPGGILTVVGLLFFFETFTNWQFAAYTWPIFPLSVAIGLFQLYLFSGRQPALLIPVFILTAVSGFAFTIMFVNTINKWVDFSIIFPTILIIIGVITILRGSKSK